jgi:hypothetical protein
VYDAGRAGLPGTKGEGMSKYHATPTEVDGIRFASKAEARRYGELLLMEREGEIMDIRLQPRFPLLVNSVKVGTYVADFMYLIPGQPPVSVVEDVKGAKTPVYRLKKKIVEAQYGIEIQEVSA